MLLGSMALWGGTWPVGRVVARTVAPWNAALLRFIMATAVLFLICLRTEGRALFRLPRALLPRLLALGATGIFGYSFLFFSGLKTTPAGRAALIVGCIPVCIALGSSLLVRRWPRRTTTIGIVLSLVGVAMVLANGSPVKLLRESIQIGDLMILGAVLCWTTYTLCARAVMKKISPLVAVTWSCVIGSVLILPFALAGHLWQDVTGSGWVEWAGLAYLGVAATSFGYYWYYKAIHHVGPVVSGIFINLVPLFAVLLGCIFLDEKLYVPQLAGGLMVICGVFITCQK